MATVYNVEIRDGENRPWLVARSVNGDVLEFSNLKVALAAIDLFEQLGYTAEARLRQNRG